MAAQPIPVQPVPEPRTRKKLLQRAPRDYSQKLRRSFQAAFLLLNLWIGYRFVQFVHFYESGAQGVAPARPAGVEGWLPIAALMNLKATLLTWKLPEVHPAGLFLLLAFLGMSLLLKKSFCGWLCPVGTVSEYLWQIGRKLFRRNFRIHTWVDIPLRSLKYILLALFLYAVGSMPVEGIRAFLGGPYGVVADVKMLNFFRFLSTFAAWTIAILVVLSVFVQNFWCRYLCPYGALMGLAALFSPTRIRRDAGRCIDCSKCAKACPSSLPVDKLVTIRSAECTACMECVAVCPADGALQLSVIFPAPTPARHIPAWAMAASIAVIFFGLVGFAKATGHWSAEIPSWVYSDLVPHASEYKHP